MINQYFKNLKKSIKISIEKDYKNINARKKYVLSVADLGVKLYNEKTIAFCGISTPFELLNAMNITSCFVEFIGATLAAHGSVDKFIDIAEQNGYTTDSCAYHRAVAGAMLKNILPIPDFIIATSSPCTSGLTLMENIAKFFKKKMFILNIPQNSTKNNIHYLSNQIKNLVNFISQQTKQPLNKNNLYKSINLSNKARKLLSEAFDIISLTPSPVNNRLMRDFTTVSSLFFGTQNGVEICKAIRDELKEKALLLKKKTSNEKLRIIWIQNRIQFKNPIDNMLEKMGVKIVIDELNSIPYENISYDDPYTSMAKKIISFPLNTKSSNRIKNLKYLIKKYSIDGAINPCHWGCRQGAGIRGMISDSLKNIGIPVLNLEVDCIDSRNFPEEQLKTRIEAFVEMLKA